MKSWLRSRVLRSGVFKSAAQLFSGRVVAMALGVVAAPVIARLFTPEHYGIAAVFIAITTIAATLLPAGYHRAVLFPREDEAAANLFVLSLIVSVGFSLLLYVLMAAAAIFRPGLPEAAGLHDMFWLLPLGALLLVSKNATGVVLLRRGAFASIATLDAAQSGVLVSSRIIWGLAFGSAATGLVLGHLASLVIATYVSWRLCGPWVRASLPQFSWRGLFALAAEFKDYPLFRLSAQVAFITANQLPILALNTMFPPSVVGFYAMADRVAGLPLQAASLSLSGAILKKSISDRHGDRPVSPAIWKAALVLAVVGVPTFTIMFFFGGDVLTWMLGARWFEAGEMLEILSIFLFVQWLTSAFSPVLETLRANRLHLVLNLTTLVTRVLTFTACFFLSLEIRDVLWVFVAVSCVQYSTYIVATMFLMEKHDRRLARGVA